MGWLKKFPFCLVILLCLHGLASAQTDAERRAFAAADAAYRAYDEKRFDSAIQEARLATQLAPSNVQYARLLMYALSAALRTQEAVQAASAVLALAPADVQALAERGRLRMLLGERDGGRQDYEAALRSPAVTAAQRISLLADLDRLQEARREFAQLRKAGAGGVTDVEQAYLASRLGEDQEALDAFGRADAGGRLPSTALQDAGYAAVRAGRDDLGQQYFRRAIDATERGELALSPQSLFETRRSVAELSRRWGVFASVNYRQGGGVVPGFGSVGVPLGSAWQAGAETWWRPFGQNNGRYVELFGRGFQTLEDDNGVTGSDSRQVGLGARVKPFTQHNLVLSASRTDSRITGEDWLLQAGYSADWGTDLRRDRKQWWTHRLSGEIGRYTSRDQHYGVASVQTGRSFLLRPGDGATVAFPHLVLAAEYDSAAIRNHSAAVGAGLAVRQWFRAGRYTAPKSYVDITVQYRSHISGDERTKGWFLTTLVAF